MPRVKVMLSLIVIVLAVSLIGGATLAWFTAATDPIENVFVAGTVDIESGWQTGFDKLIEENWNPGDCSDLGLCVVNQGTKAVKLRAQFNGYWTTGKQRMLIIYKPGDNNQPYFQLLTFDWDAFCKNVYGVNGPIAEGNISLSHPYGPAYFEGVFNSFTSFAWDPNPEIEKPWLTTGNAYSVWCTDSQTEIRQGAHDIMIFDPLSNPDWHTESGVSALDRWTKIPWFKLNYIINQDYLSQGYNSNQIQNVIWYYTNRAALNKYHYMNSIKTLTAIEKEIVADVEANSGLQFTNVSFSPGEGWTYDESDGWWYYEPVVPGTFTDPTDEDRKVCISFTFCLDGAATGNEYQGANYHLISLFQAIQASHGPESDSDVTWDWTEFETYN